MDLTSMLEREDFFSSFFSTVERYFSKVLKIDIDFSHSEDKKACNMVIKPRLSAVSSVRISKKAREFYYSEWNVRNSIIKNIIAKTYVFLMTRTGKKFSQYKFTITPEPDNIRDLVIAPNNRSIRIFDYESGNVGCIIKDGFTKKYFTNQLEFRKKYKYDFMIPLLDYGDDWFREPIMQGHPLARTTNRLAYRKGIQDVLVATAQLVEDTLKYIEPTGYVAKILNKARTLVSDAKEKKDIKCYDESVRIIDKIEKTLSLIKFQIPTCISHGDLQEGNIWVENTGVTKVYDWETVGRRSVWYDTSVLLYSLRRHEGWRKLLHNNKPHLIAQNDEKKDYLDIEYKQIKNIVLLEDIIFYLEDMLELPKKWGAELYDTFILRIIQTGFLDMD